jgi:hypothetical protein
MTWFPYLLLSSLTQPILSAQDLALDWKICIFISTSALSLKHLDHFYLAVVLVCGSTLTTLTLNHAGLPAGEMDHVHIQ